MKVDQRVADEENHRRDDDDEDEEMITFPKGVVRLKRRAEFAFVKQGEEISPWRNSADREWKAERRASIARRRTDKSIGAF